MGQLIANARIIDGTSQVLEDFFIAIDGERIADIQPMAAFPETPTDPVLDAAGCTLMPGLIDCHVHLSIDGDADPVAQVLADSDGLAALRMAANAARSITAGITTVRDLGAKNHVDFAFRRAVVEGVHRASPHLVLSGQPLTMTGGHCWQFGREADGPDEVRRAAREQIRAGANCIKLMATGGILTQGNELGAAQLEEAEMRAAIEEADKAGLLTAVHAHGASGIKNGLRAGVRTVEHAYFLDDECIEMMLAGDAWLVPTAAAVGLVVAHGLGAGIPPEVVEKAHSAIDSQRQTCRKAWQAGVKIAMGTDAGTPYNRHGENAQELAAMVAMGMSPMEAIIASTAKGAELLGLADRLGTLEPGRQADLLILDGDPLADITVLREPARIAYVFKAGSILARRGHPVAWAASSIATDVSPQISSIARSAGRLAAQ